jgi:hypothetical protein
MLGLQQRACVAVVSDARKREAGTALESSSPRGSGAVVRIGVPLRAHVPVAP